MILLVDNYDSFVHNLARYLRRFGLETRVIRNDRLTVGDVVSCSPQAVVISPGPCAPSQAGCSVELVRQLHRSLPILGICLGHQVIAEALGGRIIRAREPVHGRSSLIHHTEQSVFRGLPNPLRVGRYHSLVVDPDAVPPCLRVDATLDDGTIMAIAHRDLPVIGWQFHPESILTDQGYALLANFLRLSGLDREPDCSDLESTEWASRSPPQQDWFGRAIEYPDGSKGPVCRE